MVSWGKCLQGRRLMGTFAWVARTMLLKKGVGGGEGAHGPIDRPPLQLLDGAQGLGHVDDFAGKDEVVLLQTRA